MQLLDEIATGFTIAMIWAAIIGVILIGFQIASKLVGPHDPNRDGDFDQQEIARRQG